MKVSSRILLLLALFTLVASHALANNITVSDVRLPNRNTTANPKYARVQFDLSWQNSWRTLSAPNNWDAAWVFVKFRVGAADVTWTSAMSSGKTVTVASTAGLRVGMPLSVTAGTGVLAAGTVVTAITDGTRFEVNLTPQTALDGATLVASRIWEHAKLGTTGHSSDSTYTIDQRDQVGAFIYRTANGGPGLFSLNDIYLQWNYVSNSVLDDDVVEVRVFAIEMVYVPEGSFYVGSGGTESGSFTNGSWTSGATIPLQISAQGAIKIEQTPGNLWGTSTSDTNTIGGAGSTNASYPTGFNAFYCMKYEISQQQYVDFLNTLASTQIGSHPYTSGYYRNGISGSTGAYTTTLPHVACNFLGWFDGTAYCDWAGLRPMTELEFEKACRGPVYPVQNEYAWGSANITAATGITDGGTTNETGSLGAKACYGGVTGGPLRAGAFATGSMTREASGASYWGIMELSGNVRERCITVGNQLGRNFTGLCGDGALDGSGLANVTNWPGPYDGTGAGYRGGDWGMIASYSRVSDRAFAVWKQYAKYANNGFRGVR